VQQHVRRPVNFEAGTPKCSTPHAHPYPFLMAPHITFSPDETPSAHLIDVFSAALSPYQDLEEALFDFPEVWARLTVEARQRLDVRLSLLHYRMRVITV
jgi:hypothetical protein